MAYSAKNNHNYGIDFLRILSMFFVICLHILGRGGLVEHVAADTGKYIFLRFLQIMSFCAVDIYGITTGHLMCTKVFRLSRLTKIWVTTIFWSVAVSCGFFVFVPESRSVREAISMFLPVLRGRYWFFTAYFVTMLLMPVLNAVIHTISRQQFKYLLAVLILLFGIIPVASLGYDSLRIVGGNHFVWMIALYLIGGYIRVYHPAGDTQPGHRCQWLIAYAILALLHIAYIAVMQIVGLERLSCLFLSDISVLIVGEAVCLFIYFRSVNFGKEERGFLHGVLRFVTPGVYAVYIIHVHPLVFWNENLIVLLRPWDTWSGIKVLAAMLAAAVGVFTVCVLLDAVRQWLFRVLCIDRAVEKLSDQVENKIRKILAEK